MYPYRGVRCKCDSPGRSGGAPVRAPCVQGSMLLNKGFVLLKLTVTLPIACRFASWSQRRPQEAASAGNVVYRGAFGQAVP